MKTNCFIFNFCCAALCGKFSLLLPLVAAALLLPASSWGQAASRTSMERVGSTNVYNLLFNDDPSDPMSLAGVDYWVVISGTSPSISISIPASSWLFEVGETSIEVGSPEVSGSTYKFPVTVWRDDNTPQSGSGLYMAVTVTGGLGICVEDLPGKTSMESLADLSGTSFVQGLQSAVEVQVISMTGVLVQQMHGSNLKSRFGETWQNLNSGCYIVRLIPVDGKAKTFKLLR